MNKEHFSKPAGWVIPVAEIRMEDERLFAHYDIEKEEKMMDENEQQMTHSDNTQEHFIACYIRVPHVATLDAITQAIKDNGCDNADMYAKEIYSLYSQELEKIAQK